MKARTTFEGPQDLVGEEISGIEFVRDYVEVHFDGPILRCLVNPGIRASRGEYRFPGASSRDALCELIGSSVTSIAIDEKEMRLTASNGCVLSVRLDGDDSEAMHFVPGLNKEVQVW